MTRQFQPHVSDVGDQLTAIAGSYLHSVVAGPWTACSVCALPIADGYTLCPQCRGHLRSGLPLADRTGFLVYADEPQSQTYRVMRGYKETLTQDSYEPVVEALLAVGLRAHFACSHSRARANDTGWAVVPSTRARTVLLDLVRGLSKTPSSEVRVTAVPPRPNRALRPESFLLEAGVKLPAHVVVIDDAWVTGSSAQSLAVLLKQAGVREVSILAVARVLSPDWGPNQDFIRATLPTLPYDWTVCPWTRGECP